jgi:altronate hydrolase
VRWNSWNARKKQGKEKGNRMDDQKVIQINQKDNVAVAVQELTEGSSLQIAGTELQVREAVPRGHKIALKDISEGEEIIKYGNRIGIARCAIPKGGWVHVHNIRTGLGDLNTYSYMPEAGNTGARNQRRGQEFFFQGYRRKDGSVGIRNEIWILPTVGCVNDVADAIARRAGQITGSKDIISFRHPYGCSQLGEDQVHTRKILADLVRHPNAAGVLLVGLGCENSSIQEIKKYIGTYDPQRVRFLVAQDCEDEIAQGAALVQELCSFAAGFQRERISAAELTIGLKCGGSDGLSGITANPVVGSVSDLLLSCGGSSILTEVPEMFGAENLLMNRCESREVFDKTVQLINDFKQYFIRNDQPIYENPSPGNKAGGISTLEDKSLGCTQKSGSGTIRDVLRYGDRLQKKGLSLLEAPGNDLVAATALAAAGAQLILFTTGRGTPFASPVPTIKISSNSDLAGRKKNWIDFNAGVLTEKGSVEETGEALFAQVLETASGTETCSERAGYHDMAIFKQGVTL